MEWRTRPLIYEIHTWVWLNDLSARYSKPISLENVPPEEWDALAALQIDAVWFMGVWMRSPAGRAIANANPELQNEFRNAVPNFQNEDNVGSAYCVREYLVDPHLGGPDGLARARAQLASRGIGLLLDFVPNHVAPDHPWVTMHPEYFVRGTVEEWERAPNEFFDAGGQIIANGRDPYFAPWPDVLQLNAYDAGLRDAGLETVCSIAAQCDGVRCDMAMLMLNQIFARTWGKRAGAIPQTEYWRDLISRVKAAYPDFIFIAEAYWDLEYELMQNGFDYCYDKRLYDRLVHGEGETLRDYLLAGLEYQDKLLRFIENHDEPRAAATWSPPQERAAAVVVTMLPGAKLVYDGQLEGRKTKTPVFLARRVQEPRNYELDSFYRALLKTVHEDLFHTGDWQLCERHGWSDNSTFQNIIAWTWRRDHERAVVIVNLSSSRSQAMIKFGWDDLRERIWRLADPLTGDLFLREGNQLADAGLYVDLDAWRFHFLTFDT